MKNTLHIIVTDFGNVKLSNKTLNWLNGIDSNWEEVYYNKRKRGKHARYVRQNVNELYTAIKISSIISYFNNEVLDEF